jgi:ketosteroid isomerase-like protein
MSMSQEAMDVVLDHLYARRRGDVDAVTATLDPDITVRDGRIVLMRDFRSRDDALAASVRSSLSTD